MDYETTDPLGCEEHARAIAQRITRYWRARGQRVRCTVEQMRQPPRHYFVRSDMVNGLPAGAAPEQVAS